MGNHENQGVCLPSSAWCDTAAILVLRRKHVISKENDTAMLRMRKHRLFVKRSSETAMPPQRTCRCCTRQARQPLSWGRSPCRRVVRRRCRRLHWHLPLRAFCFEAPLQSQSWRGQLHAWVTHFGASPPAAASFGLGARPRFGTGASGWRAEACVRAVLHECLMRTTHRSGCAGDGGEKRVKALVQRPQQNATLAVSQRVQRCRHQRQLHGCLGRLAFRTVAASLRLPLKRCRLRSLDGRRQHDGVDVLLRQAVPAHAACVSATHSAGKSGTCADFSLFSRRICSSVALSVVPANKTQQDVRSACAAGGCRRAPPELMMRPLLRITSSPCFASLSLRTASTSMCSPVKAGVSCALVSSAGGRGGRLAARRAKRAAHLQATAARAAAASAR